LQSNCNHFNRTGVRSEPPAQQAGWPKTRKGHRIPWVRLVRRASDSEFPRLSAQGLPEDSEGEENLRVLLLVADE